MYKRQLQGKYQERYGNASCALTEQDLQDMIEVPRLEDGDVFASAETTHKSARERALQVGLAAEKNAHDYYARLVEQTEDGPLRRLYSELSAMEDGHMTYLQSMLAASAMGGEKAVQ